MQVEGSAVVGEVDIELKGINRGLAVTSFASARSIASTILGQNRILIAGVFLYLLIRLVAAVLTGAPELRFGAGSVITSASFLLIALWSAVLFLAYLARVCFFDRSTGGLLSEATWTRFHHTYTAPARLADTGAVILLYLVASDTFVALKGLISSRLPFVYDRAFADADRILHGGQQPWLWLHPLLDSPAVTRLIWINYTYPFFLGIAGLATWLAWTERKELRGRVLIAMLLIWGVLGNGLAALLPAAGPAFYHLVTGGQDFMGLVTYLDGVNQTVGLPPVDVQRDLWSARLAGGALYGGISAMPSLHIAMATLFALVGWAIDRRLGIAATLFAVGIFIGSIHLGWHYAVDGYVSAPATVMLWLLAGWLNRVGALKGV